MRGQVLHAAALWGSRMSDDAWPDLQDELAHVEEDFEIRWWLHVVLFLLAILTTLLAGMDFTGESTFALSSWQSSTNVLKAASYSVGVMLILFAHEMGHYLQARRHGVFATPPYFLPGLPIPGVGMLPMIGTFGAVIRMELKPMRSRQLLDIAAWGPLAGFIVTVPVLFLGVYLSDVRPLVPGEGMMLGNSLLMWAATELFFPVVPEGHDVFMHPLAMAGWTGCLLTAINLLPFGQLDGGHIAYTVFKDRFNRIAPVLFWSFVVLGLFVYSGSLIMALLVYVLGVKHPPILRGQTVRGRDTWLAWASLGMFAMTFSLRPIILPSVVELILQWYY